MLRAHLRRLSSSVPNVKRVSATWDTSTDRWVVTVYLGDRQVTIVGYDIAPCVDAAWNELRSTS